MNPVKLKEGVYWVGEIDWELRNFHGYSTQRGSTYNAYLILDEKITLIDTVRSYLFDKMMKRLSSLIEPFTYSLYRFKSCGDGPFGQFATPHEDCEKCHNYNLSSWTKGVAGSL